ncbi:hypothetical protein P7C70_g4537, partial [Phenoliferia sp. Uapishka_3]
MALGKLNEEIVDRVALFCDTPTLASITRLSKATRRLATRRLYTHIEITHEVIRLSWIYNAIVKVKLKLSDRQDQYLSLLSGADFPAQEPGERYHEYWTLKPCDLPLPPSYSSGRNPSLSNLKSLRCCVPPPPTFTNNLVALQPHLERDPADGWSLSPTFIPIEIASLQFDTIKDDYGRFGGIARLFNPVEYVVRSLEPWSRCWREKKCVPLISWVSLTSITFENCLPLRPDMGDMPESFALPYMCNPLLQFVTVVVTKWDATKDGILNNVGWEVPLNRHGEYGEWPKFERLLVKVTGRDRLERAKKRVMKNIDWTGEERKKSVRERLRWELLEGEVSTMPKEWEGEEEIGGEAVDHDGRLTSYISGGVI